MRVELTEAGETERYGEVLETCFEAVGALRRDLDNAQTGARLWSELAAIDRATFALVERFDTEFNPDS